MVMQAVYMAKYESKSKRLKRSPVQNAKDLRKTLCFGIIGRTPITTVSEHLSSNNWRHKKVFSVAKMALVLRF